MEQPKAMEYGSQKASSDVLKPRNMFDVIPPCRAWTKRMSNAEVFSYQT